MDTPQKHLHSSHQFCGHQSPPTPAFASPILRSPRRAPNRSPPASQPALLLPLGLQACCPPPLVRATPPATWPADPTRLLNTNSAVTSARPKRSLESRRHFLCPPTPRVLLRHSPKTSSFLTPILRSPPSTHPRFRILRSRMSQCRGDRGGTRSKASGQKYRVTIVPPASRPTEAVRLQAALSARRVRRACAKGHGLCQHRGPAPAERFQRLPARP